MHPIQDDEDKYNIFISTKFNTITIFVIKKLIQNTYYELSLLTLHPMSIGTIVATKCYHLCVPRGTFTKQEYV